jgi:uncharacterized protein with HEPN domain
MDPEVARRLRDALVAGDAAVGHVVGLTFDDYLGSRLVRSAVEREIEIIGEALSVASRLDRTLEERIPELVRVVGMRHRLIHGYDRTDSELVWDVVQTWIQPLQERMRLVLADGD